MTARTFQCLGCDRVFGSDAALGGHRLPGPQCPTEEWLSQNGYWHDEEEDVWRRGIGRPAARVNRKTDSSGYVHVRVGDHFYAEHRVVMMAMLGRDLVKGESVHHKNGQRDDNRPENLELWVGPIRRGARASDLKCPHCFQPWIKTQPSEMAVGVDRVVEMVRDGRWSLGFRGSREFSKPVEKLGPVVIALRHVPRSSRPSAGVGQRTIYDVLGEEVAS